jgi:hypothetical protein
MHTNTFEAKALAKGIVDGVNLANQVTVIAAHIYLFVPSGEA